MNQRNVRLALAQIILRERLVDQLRLQSDEIDDLFGKLLDRESVGIDEIDGPRKLRSRVHRPQEALDEVINIPEGTGLLAIAIDHNTLTLHRLDDEIRDDPAFIGMHARPIGIEDPHHLDIEIVLTVERLTLLRRIWSQTKAYRRI